MLTRARIKNFKAWRDTGDIRLAPLTVIFGGNSAGKSSLGHLLLALKQTALLSDRKRALHLGDPTSLIDLGTFVDCLYGRDGNRKMEFSLQWRLSSALEVKNTLNPAEAYRGNELSLDAVLRAGKAEQPEIERIRYALIGGGAPQLEVDHARGLSEVTLKAKPLKLTKMQGRSWPLDPPEKFYRFADATLARFQNAGFLADFSLETERMLNALSYLGPLRSHPKRIYPWSGETPQDVGMRGEYAVAALLAAEADERKLNRGHRQRQKPFARFVAEWMIQMGVIHSFTVKPVAKGRKEYEVLIKTHLDAPEVKLTDVGFGISQVLPALVEAFYAPPNSTVWMEQPEIHLHPEVQAHLADAFISAVQAWEGGQPRNVQLMVESHSEHFLTRLQRRVAEGVIAPTDVAIYFCKRSGKSAELEPLSLDLYGNIENWPDNFFGEWCAARHSLEYARLPDWWLLFDVCDRREGRFWSTTHRDAFALALGFSVVPRLHVGRVSIAQLREWVTVKHSCFRQGHLEGVVIRRENRDWLEARARLVRCDFTQAIDTHWRSRELVWNHLDHPVTAE